MTRPREERELSVTGDEGQYVQSTEGPADDATVHTRNTPGIAPTIDPQLLPRGDAEKPAELVELRRSVRRPEEVERDRPRPSRPWSPLFTSVVVFALIVGIGTIALLSFLKRDRTSEVVVEPPPAPTEIGGVPVRPGMTGG